MLSAFLVTRANESGGRCSSDGTGRDSAAGGGRSPDGAAAAMPRPEGGGKGLTRSAATAAAAADVLRAEEDANSLEKLGAFVAEGEGGRWRSDWPEEDRAAFREGIFAFRRDFHRVRAAFLPHKVYGDVVEYFYRYVRRSEEREDGRYLEDQVSLRLGWGRGRDRCGFYLLSPAESLRHSGPTFFLVFFTPIVFGFHRHMFF